MCKKQACHLPNSELGPFRHLRLPVQHTSTKITKSVRGLPLLAPQLPQAGSHTRGSHVTLSNKSNRRVKLSMTEDAAILIVFTLQGLYTWTHSNRNQPRISQLDDVSRATEEWALLTSVLTSQR
jgi:hypothetical protein